MRIIILSLVLYLCGCSAFFPPAEKNELKSGAYWLNYDAERRGAVILPKDGDYQYCAEPAPDVARSLINKIQADIKDRGNGSIESDVNAIELAGRTNTVLIAREALYRLCEININKSLSGAEVVKMFDATISMISEVVKAEGARSNAKAAAANAVSNAISKNSSSEQVQKLIEKM